MTEEPNVLVMFRLGLDTQQIAHALAMPESQVANLLHTQRELERQREEFEANVFELGVGK